jgi:hypothetical protein
MVTDGVGVGNTLLLCGMEWAGEGVQDDQPS